MNQLTRRLITAAAVVGVSLVGSAGAAHAAGAVLQPPVQVAQIIIDRPAA